MKTITLTEAKKHFHALVDEAKRGESITITRRGKPVGILGPHEQSEKRTPREAVEGLLKNRKGNLLRGLSIKELKEEGRR